MWCTFVRQSLDGMWYTPTVKQSEISSYLKVQENSGTVKPDVASTWQELPPENYGHAISVSSDYGFKCKQCVLENATTWKMRIVDIGGRPNLKRQFNLRKQTYTVSTLAKITFAIFQLFVCSDSGPDWSSCSQAPLSTVGDSYASLSHVE